MGHPYARKLFHFYGIHYEISGIQKLCKSFTLSLYLPDFLCMMNTKTTEANPEIWLLSAYRADSHAAWADWLTQNQMQVNWHRLELPGRHFRWRIRSNPLSWLEQLPESRPDLILATSMVDLATLKGLHPRLASIPAWCYFHENQFAYPESERQFVSIDHKMVQIYSGLAADRIFFNSNFNLTSYLDGIESLLKKKPNADSGMIRRKLEPKCEVLPIPITPISPADEKDEQLIVWNHRWEYDKAPEVFARALAELAEKDIPFRLALLGDRSSRPPEALINIREKLGDRIIIDEKADSATYRNILSKSSIVVSTSLHEFQGLAMLEAVSAGARPLVPDALCYPDQYPPQYRYPPGDHRHLADRLSQWLTGSLPPPVDVSKWYGDELKTQWHRLFTDIRHG